MGRKGEWAGNSWGRRRAVGGEVNGEERSSYQQYIYIYIYIFVTCTLSSIVNSLTSIT